MSDPTAQNEPAEPTFSPPTPAPAPPDSEAPPAPQPPYQPPYGAAQPPYGAAQPPNGAAQPPYGAAQPPYGAAQPPYGAAQPPYGAARPPYAYAQAPYSAPQPPGGQAKRPIVLAIVALALAVVGLIMAFIPFVTWFSGLFLLPAFVIGLIALISKKQGGKGFSIAAVAVSVVGWIVSAVVSIASIGLVGQALQNEVSESLAPSIEPTAAPEEEATEEPDAAGDAQDLIVVESAFGRDSFDTSSWWYVVVLENPNEDYIFDFADITVEALDASGTILDSSPDFLTILSGRTAVTGTFFEVGQGEIASLDIRGPDTAVAIRSPADETGSFTIDPPTAVTDEFSTTVNGTISGDFDAEQELVRVDVVARGPDGTIVGGAFTFVDRLPVGGVKVQYEATFFDPLPPGTTFEAYASL